METSLPLASSSFVLVAAVFGLAGLIKGVVGLGLPTVSMALLALFMAPAEAATLLIIPSLVTNLWQAGPLRTLLPLLRRIGGMQLGIVAATVIASLVLGVPAGSWAAAALGVALVAYAAWGLFGTPWSLSVDAERWLGPITGVLTGCITACTGVFVVPAVPYLQALMLSPDRLVQAMGVSFTVSTLALAGGLWLNDSYSAGSAGTSAIMLIPALAGMYAGQRMRSWLSPRAFRRCFLISLGVLGAYLAIEKLLP